MRKTLPFAGASVMALGCGDGPAHAAEVQPTQSAPGQPASSLQDRTSLQFAGGMQEYTLTLDKFFDQWVYHGGFPELKVEYRWLPEEKKAHVTVEQTQTVDAGLAFA